ncbi:MAG: acyltransferase family protein [Ktedonobacterales bacterium]
MPPTIDPRLSSPQAPSRAGTPTPASNSAPPTSHTPQFPHRRLVFVDGLRALAALYVVVHHAWLQIWPVDYSRFPSGSLAVLTNWMGYGHFAVSVFIVLSGFSLMLPVVRNGWTLRDGAIGFLLRRARRILPPYYCAIGFSLLLIALLVGQKTGTHWDISLPVTPQTLQAHLLLQQDLFGQCKINHALWTIAVEWRIYFVFPLMVYLWRRAGGVATIIGTLLFAYVLAYMVGGTPWEPIMPHYLALFALGASAAAIAVSPDARSRLLRDRLPWTWLTAALFALICLACWRWGQPVGWPDRSMLLLLDTFVGLATAAALMGATRPYQQNVLQRILSWKPLAFTGTFSYSLYLIHAPLLQVVWQYIAHPLRFLGFGDAGELLITIGVGIPLILGTAYLFFRLCEQPFMPGVSTKHITLSAARVRQVAGETSP